MRKLILNQAYYGKMATGQTQAKLTLQKRPSPLNYSQ